MLSREAAFLVNNLLLLAIAFVTLWGTVYPLISRLTTGDEISVARPFYDQVNGPLLLALIFLMGVGPLLPWRRATPASLRRALLVPGSAAVIVVLILAGLGMRQEYALIGFALGAMVATGIFMEWIRGTRSRHRAGSENYPTAFFRLILANRPRYGGYIVHLSIVMVALGVIGTSFFSTQKDVVLAPGERVTVEEYELHYVGTRVEPKGNRTEFVSTVNVYRRGESLGSIEPTRAFYPRFQHGRYSGRDTVNPGRGPLRGAQRESARWQRWLPDSDKPLDLVDVGGRPGAGSRCSGLLVAPVRPRSCQGKTARFDSGRSPANDSVKLCPDSSQLSAAGARLGEEA